MTSHCAVDCSTESRFYLISSFESTTQQISMIEYYSFNLFIMFTYGFTFTQSFMCILQIAF